MMSANSVSLCFVFIVVLAFPNVKYGGTTSYNATSSNSKTTTASDALRDVIAETQKYVFISFPQFGGLVTVSRFTYRSVPTVRNELDLGEYQGFFIYREADELYYLNLKGPVSAQLVTGNTTSFGYSDLTGVGALAVLSASLSYSIVDCSTCKDEFSNEDEGSDTAMTTLSLNDIQKFYIVPPRSYLFDGVGYVLPLTNKHGALVQIVAGGACLIVSDPNFPSVSCNPQNKHNTPFNLPIDVLFSNKTNAACNFLTTLAGMYDKMEKPPSVLIRIAIAVDNEGTVVIPCFTSYNVFNRLVSAIRAAC